MFSICKLSKISSPLIYQTRTKAKTHWAKLKKKTSAKYKALEHFNDFYGSIYGKEWETMRTALLIPSKYVAVINNYGEPENTMDYFSKRGAHCIKRLMEVQAEHQNTYGPSIETPESSDHSNDPDGKLQNYMGKVQNNDIASIYQGTQRQPDVLETDDILLNVNESESQTEEKKEIKPQYKTLEQSIADAQIDVSRVIDPSLGITTDELYQYIPATKLKGMEDWIPESTHYAYYSKSKDFPLIIEPETKFTFPEHLKVFTYEMDSNLNSFPEPKRCLTGVYNYYPMDAGSVLSVLALCLGPGDRVLDMCAAPGGKSLVALQTLLPDIIVCNDSSISRSNRLHRVLKDYLYDFEHGNKWRERVLLSSVDGCLYADEQSFDKVLVDVPCTSDRYSVSEDENNIFRPDKIKHRLKIPELQSQLLSNALSLVKVGGAVVYSTCTLSPVQNDGVVHMALKHAFEAHGVVAEIRDLTSCLAPLSSTLRLCTGAASPKYGQLVVPYVGANFGPSYFSRLVRVK